MSLSDEELKEVQKKVNSMLMETIGIIELIEKNADVLFGENANQIKLAINEYMKDFIKNTYNSGEKHPEELIYNTSKESFQKVGFYGSQLDLKERQVMEANNAVQESLMQCTRSFFRSPFKKWIDRINSFLGSLVSAIGVGEALKELKDCLRDELPDDDD